MSTIVNKIESILTSEYSTANFVELMREIFDSMKIVAPNNFRQEFSNFSTHIVGCAHVGNYTTPEDKKIAIFAVQLKKENYVEGSRSTQRSYAKKLIEGGNCDAAIVAFYTECEPKWRLSFVRLDYEMKIEQGKLKTTENITPAKRYSFLVGKDEPSHTAIDRFRQFIIDQNSNPSLDEIEEAFSVEKVTKEFFDLYCEKFYQLQKYLDANEDFVEESKRCGFTSEQYAKKLMGQIVFLYFLQKKGWLGVSVWTPTLTEKEYKNIYFVSGAQGRIIKEHLPKIYIGQPDGTYRLNSKALDMISDDNEEVIANHMVRKKTWGDGSKKFLRTIFEYSKTHKGHFFENYLEPLFYDTLNKNRGAMGYCPALHARVPFLSGGLFEPLDGYDWKSNCFDIPDEIFSNKQDANDRNADGILDIFDRYNFTMSEDEPMEREVAIDPEMLGKIFENLLEIKDRKSNGAFYTPREIVHYMCQESLINYLIRKTNISEDALRDFILYGDFMKDEDTVKSKREGNGGMYISDEIFKINEEGNIVVNRLKDIDDALASVRVADPAVGSGAFPLGMVNEIVRARANITSYLTIGMNANDKRLLFKNERSPYALKFNAVRNSIFAVDIEPSAVDITQLRLWLSLVIDDEITPDAANELEGHKNPLPLPNLECNILCGNSLNDKFEGIELINESKLICNTSAFTQINMGRNAFETILKELLSVQDKLFVCDEPNRKMELKAQIQSLKDMIIEEQMQCCSEELKESYMEAIQKSSKPFTLWHLDFARVFRDNGGFDIVIGNPPYVQLQKSISDDMKLGDLYEDLGFETFAKTGDIYCLFYEKGYNLLCKDGILSFITSNKWMRAGYGKRLRAFLANKSNPIKLIDFGGTKVFESATVDVNILMLAKQKNMCNTLACTIKDDCQNNLSVYVERNSSTSSFDNDDGWTIMNPIETSIKKKIQSNGVQLKDWNIQINYGIKTGFNDAFIISKEKKDELIAADPKSAEIIRPILRGRDIKRYEHTFADLWLINTHNGIKSKNIPPINIEDYPAIKDHLDNFYSKLEKRADKGDTPYNLRNCVYMDDFSKQKIIYPETTQGAYFILDNGEFYLDKTCFFMISEYPHYLIATLSSKLFEYAYKHIFSSIELGASAYQYNKHAFVLLPVIEPSKVDGQTLIQIKEYVDAAMIEKSHNLKQEIIKKIDTIIYNLYDISNEEILHIEGIS